MRVIVATARKLLATAKDQGFAYHGTGLFSLFSIIDSNELRLSHVAGKEAELEFSKTPYFLSVRRNKKQPHHYYQTTIEFKEQALHSRMSRMSVDYWGKVNSQTATEQEDRYFSRKPVLKNARRLIRAVHIDLAQYDPQRTGAKLRKMMLECARSKIKVYCYTDPKAYRSLNTRKSVKINEISYGSKAVNVFVPKSQEDQEYENEMRPFKHKRWKSEQYPDSKFVVDMLYSGNADKRAEYDYVRESYGRRMYENDMKHQMGALLHNASHGTDLEKRMAARIQDYMKKHNMNVEQLAFHLRDLIKKADQNAG